MTTKINPGAFDCLAAALPDEPMFILLARDASAPGLIRAWADTRRKALLDLNLDDDETLKSRYEEDLARCRDADMISHDMQAWRKNNEGVWRANSSARAPMADINPALRDEIAARTHLSLCNFAAIGTAQAVMVEHRINNWTQPGFAIRRHYFRFESTGPHFEKLIGAAAELPDWKINGWDIALGDVMFRVKRPDLIAVEIQTVGG